MGSRIAASAVVLAGGRSSRMGTEKAALRFGDSTLLGRIVAELATVFDDIVIVASPHGEVALHPESPVTLIRDEREYEGPAGALARGLAAARHDSAFGCACDLPMLSARVASAMVSMLGGYDAVIAEVGGNLQPLHAAYRRRCAAAFDAMIARGVKRLRAIAGEVRVRTLAEDEARAIDPDLASFANINTPEDYYRTLAMAGFAAARRD